MTLLPEIERELLRVARQPAPRTWSGQRRRWTRRAGREVGQILRLAAPVAALAIGIVFLVSLGGHPRSSKPVSHRPLPTRGRFPGAPTTQPAPWMGGGDLCPLARPNRYLPPRSGCVSVLQVDVDGDGRPDLVLLYAHLSHRSYGHMYVPTGFTLQVDRASGGIVRAHFRTELTNAALIEAGNVNALPGDELFVQTGRISSGSAAVLYTYHDSRLIRLPVTLGWGGDSATQAGFACRSGHPPRLVSRSFELVSGGEDGRWSQTRTVYAWHGARLERISHETTDRHGPPPPAETQLGNGCGVVDRATKS